jgi:membrane associated rhomboid family serine protease
MNRPSQLGFAFPKPGRGLKGVLIALLVVGVVESLLFDQLGLARVFSWLVCDTNAVLHGQVWRLFTAGFLTDPHRIAPLLFTLVGLYFFSPDLESRWGTPRFLRFLAWSTIVGFSLGVLIDGLAPESLLLFHPGPMFGAVSAIVATSVAWARANANAQVRLFLVFPITGRAFLWITVLYCVANLVWPGLPEGVVAPFGGLAAGMLLSGDPSPLRRAYLKAKLRYLRRNAGNTPTAHEIVFGRPAETKKKARRASGPALRVLPGGLDEDLSKRDPPKDKRYLN